MTKEHILETLRNNIKTVIPKVNAQALTMEDSLREIGANSIDRMEILITTMESLGIKTSMVEFASAANIEDIVTIFHSKLSSEC